MSVGSWMLARAAARRTPPRRSSCSACSAPCKRLARGRVGASARRSRPTPARCSPTRRSPCGTRRGDELPFVFGASAAASRRRGRGAADTAARHAGPARRLAIGGAVAELAAMQLMGGGSASSASSTGRARPGAQKARRRAPRRARRCSRCAASAAGAAAVAGGALVLGRRAARCAGRSSRRASSRRATRATRSSRRRNGLKQKGAATMS